MNLLTLFNPLILLGRPGCLLKTLLTVCRPQIFFNKVAFFEEGEKTGRLLVKIVQSQQASPSIGAIHSKPGRVVNTPELITKKLADFYVTLNQPSRSHSLEVLTHNIHAIPLPTLTVAQCKQLDAPITFEELQRATGSFPTCKALGMTAFRQRCLCQDMCV